MRMNPLKKSLFTISLGGFIMVFHNINEKSYAPNSRIPDLYKKKENANIRIVD